MKYQVINLHLVNPFFSITSFNSLSMKNFNLAFIIALMVTVTIGCGKDEAVANLIVGEWCMTDTHADDGIVVHTIQGQEEIQTFSYHGIEYNATTTFTENPDQFTSGGYYKYEYTTTFLGNTETIILQSDALAGTGQWANEGDTLSPSDCRC